jgi:hypothetical protein
MFTIVQILKGHPGRFYLSFLPTFDVLSQSVFIYFDFMSFCLYFPFNVMSHSAFISFDLMSFWLYFLFDIMSHSAFSTFSLMPFHLYFPINVMSFLRFVPFDVFSVNVLSHSSFCLSTFFYCRGFLHRCFVSELD